MRFTNWAGNLTYKAENVVRPRTVAEVRAAVRSATTARALGSRHSFSAVADTTGTLISTDRLADVGPPDRNGRVRVGPGATYGRVARVLTEHRRTLANFASLPHISVGGAVATATHGSGPANASLASSVCALELVLADGSTLSLGRGDGEFDGAVVSLGALGVVTALVLETLPQFMLRQYVFEDVPWEVAEDALGELLAHGYSTSLFLSWAGATIEQAWVKTPHELASFAGARAAAGPRHPIATAEPSHCTEQLGVPGQADQRLPHFRLEGIPSAGDELQSEYAVRAADGGACVRALRSVGHVIAPLLHTSEIRAVAADDYWLSPFYKQDAVAFHFTWKRHPDVFAGIGAVEEALAAWRPRPHWGKLFLYEPADVRARYPRAGEFGDLRRTFDPEGKFANAFVDAHVPAARAPALDP